MSELFIPSAELDQLATAAFESDSKAGRFGSVPVTWQTLGADGRERYRQLVLAVMRKASS